MFWGAPPLLTTASRTDYFWFAVCQDARIVGSLFTLPGDEREGERDRGLVQGHADRR